MACRSCSHTMQALSAEAGTYWCPRCGACLVGDAFYVPALVERVRELKATMKAEVGFSEYDVDLWWKLGITESVWKPGERQ